jgi:hypothetical protein
MSQVPTGITISGCEARLENFLIKKTPSICCKGAFFIADYFLFNADLNGWIQKLKTGWKRHDARSGAG